MAKSQTIDKAVTENLSIKRKTRAKTPNLPFLRIQEKILGKNFSLSLVFVTPKESHSLNKRLRKKNKPANILTFPLSKKSGEIIITPLCIKKDAPLFGLTYEGFFLLCFVHGLLHLKGTSHGRRMEEQEKRMSRAFSRTFHISYESSSHRNRN